MMITTELVSANVLLVANVLLLGAAAIELLRFKRVLRRHGNVSGSKPASDSAGEERVPDQLNQLMDQRIAALQKIADDLSRKEQVLQRADPRESPYESAVRLARRGANVEQLTACGLNQGEAQLMVRLYANNASKNAAAE